MEGLGVLSCGACMGAAAFLVSGGGRDRHVSGWGVRMTWRVFRDLLVRMGASPLVSMLLKVASWNAFSDEIARRLRAREAYVSREDACAIAVAALVLTSVCAALLSRSPIGLVVGVIGFAAGVVVWHSSRVRARERALVDEMPEVFRTLAMALGSGETLTQAVEYVGVHEHGYAGEAFVHAALRLRCGASTEEAMDQLARELDAPGVGLLTTALVIAQRTGSPLRGLFQSSARLVERQGEYERLLAVKTAQVRLSVRIVCLLPLLLVCLLSLISVDFQNGLTTLPGTICLLAATCMDGLALLIIRHLMRGVL